jgi:hypothetical protein
MALWNLLNTTESMAHSWNQKQHTRVNVKSRMYGMEHEKD